ncbi:hypothetical protein NDU88_008666 [Pleurodeles waltl]|uniref:Uncharacterized protein n=1 Tax=Pleurodeles waltl TaxID=8319 RepID=A0AAV7RTX4_PLEWA|nr:hypothetical protein NDU88_008666 [Pleurodeles waltl]
MTHGLFVTEVKAFAPCVQNGPFSKFNAQQPRAWASANGTPDTGETLLLHACLLMEHHSLQLPLEAMRLERSRPLLGFPLACEI